MDEIAGFFIGIGVLMLMSTISYMVYQFVRIMRTGADRDELEYAFYNAAIKKKAKSKGYDLDKEIARESLMKKVFTQRTFQSELKKEILDDIFGKETKKKEE